MDDSIEPVQPFEGLIFKGRFQSRKNDVYLVGRDGKQMVLKLYRNDRCQVEFETLNAAHKAGVPVPSTIEMREKALLMEYVPGMTVNDYLGTAQMDEMVLGVADWLASYHRAFYADGLVRLKSDAIFKNFIASDRVYGIDFELSRPGRPEVDVGEALAYFLSTYPTFTDDKYHLSGTFIERYERRSGIQLQDVDTRIAESLREEATFRPGQCPLLLKKASEIEDKRPFSPT